MLHWHCFRRHRLTVSLFVVSSDILLGLGTNLDDLQSRLKDLSLTQQQTIHSERQRSTMQESIARSLHDHIDRLETAHQRSRAAQELRLGQQIITLQDSVGCLPASLQRVEFRISAMEAARVASTAETVIQKASPSENSTALSITMGLPNVTSIQPITLGLVMTCFANCTCVCHRYHRRNSPTLIERFLGILFLGYCGLPCVTPKCDNSSCMQRSTPRALVMYHFPAWLLARAFLLTARWFMTNGLEFSIRIPRMLSGTARTFSTAEKGNIESMKALFRQGLGSPFDVNGLTGDTLLTVRRE